MSKPRANSDDRCAQATIRVLDLEYPPTGRWLVVDERTGAVERAAVGHGCQVSTWHRIAGPWTELATAGPPSGPFDGAVLRIPRTRDAYNYAVERIAAQLRPQAPLFIAGSNDEGIKNLPSDLVGFASAETVQTKFHARVWRLVRTEAPARPDTAAYLRPTQLALPGGPAELTGAPGLFAKSGLDPASSMLLSALSMVDEPVMTMLDFGCGAGVLSAGALQRWPDLAVWAADADALAIAAFDTSFPTAKSAIGDGWAAFARMTKPQGGFDLILSNPPLHRATNHLDLSVMEALIARSKDYLAPGGRLLLVTQRQRAITRALAAALSNPEVLAEDGRYRVWSARLLV